MTVHIVTTNDMKREQRSELVRSFRTGEADALGSREPVENVDRQEESVRCQTSRVVSRHSEERQEGKGREGYDHVFIIHTHGNAPQVERLVNVLRRTCANTFILISHDQAAPPLALNLKGVSDASLITGPGGRGDFAIVDGYLAALRWLEREGIRYRWVSNLSGQDYPIRSMREFLATCQKSQDVDGFIHYFDAFKASPETAVPWTWDAREGFHRYHFRYRKLARNLSWAARAAIWPLRKVLDVTHARWRIHPSYGLMFGSYQANVPFNENFRCFAGSYWHTLNSRCTKTLLSLVGERPDILRYFRSALVPDESFVQTLLANAPDLRLKNDNLRLIDMTNSRHGHPKVFIETDLPDMLASGKFFVRKVNLESGSMLDRLDEYAAS